MGLKTGVPKVYYTQKLFTLIVVHLEGERQLDVGVNGSRGKTSVRPQEPCMQLKYARAEQHETLSKEPSYNKANNGNWSFGKNTQSSMMNYQYA